MIHHDTQTNDMQTIGTQTNDMQTNDMQTNDMQTNDMQTNDMQTIGTQTNVMQTIGTQTNDMQTNEMRTNDMQTIDTRNNDTTSNYSHQTNHTASSYSNPPPETAQDEDQQHNSPLMDIETHSFGAYDDCMSMAQTDTKVDACWMCRYSCSTLCTKISMFINEKIIDMEVGTICEQIREMVLETHPAAEGIELEQIRLHILQHMITPNIKIAGTIRSMSSISESIRQNIFKYDEEAGMVVMDKTSAELYLKFTAQLCAIYKLDPSKALFGNTSQLPVPDMKPDF
jgi:hypothetical protein